MMQLSGFAWAPPAAAVLCAALAPVVVLGALPPGPGPFGSTVLPQPVTGALVFSDPKVCDVSKSPYSATNGTNATAVLSQAIEDCGGLAGGGVVLVPPGLTLFSASLFMKSNLTLRVQGALVGTATGSTKTPESIADAPIVWARRNALMTDAHAGFINGGRCLQKAPAQSVQYPDGCVRWSKLENVVLEGGGTLDADGSDWYEVWGAAHTGNNNNARPMMIDMMWVNGLTIQNLAIRRPGYWTVHPTFSDNVVVRNNSIITTGSNTDGCDPDSSWNVYIAENTFSTGDDCIAIKSGRDWSGRLVNISTRNVLAENNYYLKGHGVSIGSETSGWVYNVTIRDSVLHGTNLAVRLKTARGRGGGIKEVLYQNLSGTTTGGIQINLHYGTSAPTNISATPEVQDITVRDLDVSAGMFLNCVGLSDSPVSGIVLDNVRIKTKAGVDKKPSCSDCSVHTIHGPPGSSPDACKGSPSPPSPPTPPPNCTTVKVLGCYDDSQRGSILPAFQPQTHDKTTFAVCAEACNDAEGRPTVAGIDGGNHCYCGVLDNLKNASARQRPASECEGPCRGDRRITPCGGTNRLIAYTFSCASH